MFMLLFFLAETSCTLDHCDSVLESMKLEPIHAEVGFGFGSETRWHNGECGLTQSCIRW